MKDFERISCIKTILNGNPVAGKPPKEAQTKKFVLINSLSLSPSLFEVCSTCSSIQHLRQPPLVNDLFYGDIDGLLLITPKDFRSLSTLSWSRSMADVSINRPFP